MDGKSYRAASLALFLFLLLSTCQAAKKRKEERMVKKCATCKEMAKKFREGLQKTENKNFGGGNADWEETRLGSWAQSETRFVEITESLCESSDHDCNYLLEENEESLEDWWFNHQNQKLISWFCINTLKICCPDNTYGPECKECDGGKALPCSGGGECIGGGTRTGTGKCKCNDGNEGDLCQTCRDGYYKTESSNDTFIICLGCHISCNDICTGGTAKDCNECKDGWEFSDQEECSDIDECEDLPCEENKYCSNTEGSYKCELCDQACDQCLGSGPGQCTKCKVGYQMEEAECKDINECQDEAIQCDVINANSECKNTAGSYHCDCKEGFQKMGEKCVEKELVEKMKKKQPANQQKPTLLALILQYFIYAAVLILTAYVARGKLLLAAISGIILGAYYIYTLKDQPIH